MTLVEILVVVAIVGILAAMAAPKFTALVGENQLDGDANELFHEIQWARTAALKTGNRLSLEFADTTVSGRATKRWAVYQWVPGTATPVTYTKTPVRVGVLGVSVEPGLPDGIAAPSTSVSALFSGLSAPSGGFQGSSSASLKVCTNGSHETWSDGILFCGGSASDVETGALSLYSTRSAGRAHVLVFNRSKSLVPRRFRYLGGWQEN